jgi:hypothetical protein
MDERIALISINSASRANRSGTSPNSYIATFPDLSNVYALQVVSAEIPNAQYQLNQYNNAIDVSVNSSPTQTVTITPGNYSVTDLASAVQTALQQIDVNFAVLFSATTDRLRITHSTDSFVLVFASGPSWATTAAGVLGFSKDADFYSVLTGGLYVAQAPYIVQLQGDAYVNLCMQGIGTIGNTEGIPDVAAKVVFPTATRMASLRSLIAPVIRFEAVLGVFRAIHVCLTRPDGTLYDCNNMDHSFTIQVWQLPAQYYQ